MKIKIHLAKKKDITQIRKIYKINSPEFSKTKNGKHQIKLMANYIQHKTMLVAETSNKLVGFGAVDFDKFYSDAFIGPVFILPLYQGKGIGTLIVKRIENIARKKDCKNIISCTWSTNKISINFHKTLGYKTIGYLNYMGPYKEKTIYFRKSL